MITLAFFADLAERKAECKSAAEGVTVRISVSQNIIIIVCLKKTGNLIQISSFSSSSFFNVKAVENTADVCAVFYAVCCVENEFGNMAKMKSVSKLSSDKARCRL